MQASEFEQSKEANPLSRSGVNVLCQEACTTLLSPNLALTSLSVLRSGHHAAQMTS